MKKVLIVAPDTLGYIVKITHNLKKKNVNVTDIHIPNFVYGNNLIRAKNFFLKKIFKDVKFKYREKFINTIILDEQYDLILVIRPDFFSIQTLENLKSRTKYFKTYFFDGVFRFPRKLKTLHLFDEIYSFDPNDCKKFGFKPLTNFIYEESLVDSSQNKQIKYSVFNITTYDKHRFKLLLNIAAFLKNQKLEYKIIVKTNKKITSDLIDIINEPMKLEDTKILLENSICMLDFGAINEHKGLTFRVFEAMGLGKKLITNNSDIANYDFYDPKNILIIDENNIHIPISFIRSEYNPIPKEIFNKYTIDSWVNTVFKEILE
jgi:hypothetical protein